MVATQIKLTAHAESGQTTRGQIYYSKAPTITFRCLYLIYRQPWGYLARGEGSVGVYLVSGVPSVGFNSRKYGAIEL